MIRPVDNSLWYSKSGVFKRSADGKFIPQKRLYQPPTLFGAAAGAVLRTNQDDWFAKKLITSSDELFTISACSASCPHSTPDSWLPSQFLCPAKYVYRQKNYWCCKNVNVYPDSHWIYVPK